MDCSSRSGMRKMKMRFMGNQMKSNIDSNNGARIQSEPLASADAGATYVGGIEGGSSFFTNALILEHMLVDPLNILLVFAPMGVYASFRDMDEQFIFGTCFLGLVPLAKLLGDATEHLAENLNQTIGGLLNATFGNAVEMIITVNAIRHGDLEIVKTSLLGSILSNLLLVLGMAFFVGGLTRQEQHFSGALGIINSTMLFVGVMSFSLPTVFALTAEREPVLQA